MEDFMRKHTLQHALQHTLQHLPQHPLQHPLQHTWIWQHREPARTITQDPMCSMFRAITSHMKIIHCNIQCNTNCNTHYNIPEYGSGESQREWSWRTRFSLYSESWVSTWGSWLSFLCCSTLAARRNPTYEWFTATHRWMSNGTHMQLSCCTHKWEHLANDHIDN